MAADYTQTKHPLNKALILHDTAQIVQYTDNIRILNTPDENGNTPLHIALKCKLFAYARDFVLKGANVNIRNADCESPFLLAIKSKHTPLIELMMKSDISLTQCDKNNTPLLTNAILYKAPIVKELIDKGAQINAANIFGITPLLASIAVKNLKICNYLISRGALIDKSDSRPLFWAIEHKNFSLFQCLIDVGCSPFAPNEAGETVFEKALALNDARYADKIKKHQEQLTLNDTEKTDNYSSKPILQTPQSKSSTQNLKAKERPFDGLEYLLNEALNMPDDGYTLPVLHHIEQTPAPNLDEIKLINAFYNAINTDDEKKFDALTKSQKILNLKTITGEPPLLYTLKNNNLKYFNRLIEKGVNLNATDSHGMTALLYAVQEKREKEAIILLQKGADASIPNEKLTTAETILNMGYCIIGYKKYVVNPNKNFAYRLQKMQAQKNKEHLIG